MADSDLRRAIVEHLTRPAASRRAEDEPRGDRGEAHWVARVVRGNAARAQAASIELVKGRGTEERQLFAVRFSDEDDRPWFSLVAAERDTDGSWVPHTVAAAGDSLPRRSSPWLNLAGRWGQGHVYAGGPIDTAGAEVASVSLTLADGSTLDADAEDDVALFISDRDAQPTSVRIFGNQGQLLATHDA